jgi:hypothetical protein
MLGEVTRFHLREIVCRHLREHLGRARSEAHDGTPGSVCNWATSKASRPASRHGADRRAAETDPACTRRSGGSEVATAVPSRKVHPVWSRASQR